MKRTPPQKSHQTWPDIVFGKNPVAELLRASRRKIFEVLLAGEFKTAADDPLIKQIKAKNIPIKFAEKTQLDHLTHQAVHQNIVARVEKYPFGSLNAFLQKVPDTSLLLILDSITDPQNFGTLCRSALAFGVSAILIPQDHAANITGSVCKASSGAVEHLNIMQVVNLARSMDELKKAGFWIYGASLEDRSVALSALKPAAKSAIVLGSEGRGLRRLVAETCDELVKIPMAGGFDSLNVAQAGTVFLYDFASKILK